MASSPAPVRQEWQREAREDPGTDVHGRSGDVRVPAGLDEQVPARVQKRAQQHHQQYVDRHASESQRRRLRPRACHTGIGVMLAGIVHRALRQP